MRDFVATHSRVDGHPHGGSTDVNEVKSLDKRLSLGIPLSWVITDGAIAPFLTRPST